MRVAAGWQAQRAQEEGMAMASSIRRALRARQPAGVAADAGRRERVAPAGSRGAQKPRRLRRVLLGLLGGLILLGGTGYFWLVGDLPSVEGLAAQSGFQSSR